MRRTLCLGLVLGALGCGSTDAEPDPSYPWQVTFLAGTSDYDRQAELWVSEWDGSSRRLLFRSDGRGPGLEALRPRPGHPLIYTIAAPAYRTVAFDVRSGQVDTIPGIPVGGPMVWSPDGEWIAHPGGAGVPGTNTITMQVRSFDGSSPTSVSPVRPGLQCIGPIEWSPSSLDLFFTCSQLAGTTFVGWHFRRARRDGSTQDSIGPAPTPPVLAWLAPVWSPDGEAIALWCDANELCVARPDGTEQRSLGIRGTFYYLAWAPGPVIALYLQEGNIGQWGLWLVRPDGTGATRIASSTGPRPVKWSPDGRYLLTTLGGRGLVVFSADGQDMWTVVDEVNTSVPPVLAWDWVTR